MGIFTKKDNIHKAMKTILEQHPEIHVIDIGANRGDFVRTVVSINSDCQITAIEPIPSLAHNLSQKFKNYTNITIVNKAIVSGPSDCKFNWYPEREELSGFNRLSDNAATNYRITKSEQINVATMTCNELTCPTNRDCFIKIDIQGTDLAILHELPKKLLSSVVGIMCEIPVNGIYEKKASWLKFFQWFETNGFEPYCFQDVSRNGGNRLIEFDCIMLKNYSTTK